MEHLKEAKNVIIEIGKTHNATLEDVSKIIKTLYDTTIKEIEQWIRE